LFVLNAFAESKIQAANKADEKRGQGNERGGLLPAAPEIANIACWLHTLIYCILPSSTVTFQPPLQPIHLQASSWLWVTKVTTEIGRF
jgi:hypothetical protein